MSKIEFKRPPPIQGNDPDASLWRLPTVLANFPISRSGWYQGVKDGRYPAPVHLSTKVVCWRAADIRRLIDSL